MMRRDDGYLCADLDADLQCDSYALFAPEGEAPDDSDDGPTTEFFTVSAGALSGQTATVRMFDTALIVAPFDITIDAESEQAEREIAETFELQQPS